VVDKILFSLLPFAATGESYTGHWARWWTYEVYWLVEILIITLVHTAASLLTADLLFSCRMPLNEHGLII